MLALQRAEVVFWAGRQESLPSATSLACEVQQVPASPHAHRLTTRHTISMEFTQSQAAGESPCAAAVLQDLQAHLLAVGERVQAPLHGCQCHRGPYRLAGFMTVKLKSIKLAQQSSLLA